MSPARTCRDDRGSVSVFAVLAVTVLVLFVGVAVDLSGALHTQQRAQDVARQAARAGAEAVAAEAAVTGSDLAADPARAAMAVRAHLAAAGLEGSVTTSGRVVTVRTAATYRPVLLGVAGIGPFQVTGLSTAGSERAVEGVSR